MTLPYKCMYFTLQYVSLDIVRDEPSQDNKMHNTDTADILWCDSTCIIFRIQHASHVQIFTTYHATCCGNLFSQIISYILKSQINIVFSPYLPSCVSSVINTYWLAFVSPAIHERTVPWTWRNAIIRGSSTDTDPLKSNDVARKIELL